MNYTNFTVYGFPRSGQHYLSALVARNFFDDSFYEGRTGAHKLTSPHLGSDDTAILYVVRYFEAVAASIFKVRHHFRLRAYDLRALKELPVEQMFTPELSGTVDFNPMGKVERITKQGKAFLGVKGTLKRAWRDHISAWSALAAKHGNVHIVQYNQLTGTQFDDAMLKVARFLGSDKTEFENIRERVGWYPPGEYWSRGT